MLEEKSQNKILLSATAKSEDSNNIRGIQSLIEKAGGGGYYQITIYAIYCALWIVIGAFLTGLSFLFDSSLTCTDSKLSQEACLNYICGLEPSNRQSQISSHASSFVFETQEFLICEKGTFVPLLQSMIFVGALLGLLVFTHVSDNWGRKMGILMGWGCTVVGIGVLIVAQNVPLIGIGIVITGLSLNLGLKLTLCLINQQCLGKIKQRFITAISIFYAIGQFLIGLLFELGISYKMVLLILLVISIMLFVLIKWFVEQTPCFLALRDHVKLLKVLNIMAKRNKRTLLNSQDIQNAGLLQDTNAQKQKTIKLVDVLQYQSLRWMIISGGFIFFSIDCIYNSTSLFIDSVGLGMFINQTILSVSEIPSYIIISLFIYKLPRKRWSYILFGMSSAIYLILGISTYFKTQENEHTFKWIESSGLMVNRFLIGGYFTIFYVHITEMLPTDVRSICIGIVSVAGMVGSILAPYLRPISEYSGINYWLIQCALGLLAGSFVICLPETLGKRLKQRVDQRNEAIRISVGIQDTPTKSPSTEQKSFR